jgi:hypothetical protein
VLAAGLAFWLGLSTYKLWWGDFTIGPRFYVVMAPFLAYGLLGLLRWIPISPWVRRLGRVGVGLLVLYSGVLYWVLSAWSARWYHLDSLHPVIPRITYVFREMVQAVREKPARLMWLLEPTLPWKRMIVLASDRTIRSTARQIRLEWGDAFEYDPVRSLLRIPLRLRAPDSVGQERGFLLLRLFQDRPDGRPSHPQDWIAFLQLGPLPRLSRMEEVTADFLFRGAAVSPTDGSLELHYRWNPHYGGLRFPGRLYVCSAYQGSPQTAVSLGCSTHRVVRRLLGSPMHSYRVLLSSPYEPVLVEKQGLEPVALRVEVRTLRGRLVLEPDVRILTGPVEDLQASLFLGHRLAHQASPFRGPLVLTLITDRPVRIQHRPYSSE